MLVSRLSRALNFCRLPDQSLNRHSSTGSAHSCKFPYPILYFLPSEEFVRVAVIADKAGLFVRVNFGHTFGPKLGGYLVAGVFEGWHKYLILQMFHDEQ